MAKTLDQWKAELRRLPSQDRAELAHFLLASLEPREDGTGLAWKAEIARRVEEIRGGRAIGKPAEQLFAELREQYHEKQR
jgi:putative addiction module component (TIGR02574 family)